MKSPSGQSLVEVAVHRHCHAYFGGFGGGGYRGGAQYPIFPHPGAGDGIKSPSHRMVRSEQAKGWSNFE